MQKQPVGFFESPSVSDLNPMMMEKTDLFTHSKNCEKLDLAGGWWSFFTLNVKRKGNKKRLCD